MAADFMTAPLPASRTKGNTITAIGIAYESQKMDKVPTGYFDRRLDGVLTPSGLIMG
jgi:5-formyltetrahydrofolate cyclo-ligase